MRTLNDIEVLERNLHSYLPHVTVAIDAPANEVGIWYADVRHNKQALTIQWSPDGGFGLSAKAGGYGEGADEVYSTAAEVVSRVAELLDFPPFAASR